MAKILVIDDDHDIVQLIRYCLKVHGHEVITATDGVEGFVKAKEDHPDLLILDVIMPNLNGYELIREFKNTEELKKTPVIILTGRPQLQNRFKEEGFDHYFTKPFEIEEILEKVSLLVG